MTDDRMMARILGEWTYVVTPHRWRWYERPRVLWRLWWRIRDRLRTGL